MMTVKISRGRVKSWGEKGSFVSYQKGEWHWGMTVQCLRYEYARFTQWLLRLVQCTCAS